MGWCVVIDIKNENCILQCLKFSISPQASCSKLFPVHSFFHFTLQLSWTLVNSLNSDFIYSITFSQSVFTMLLHFMIFKDHLNVISFLKLSSGVFKKLLGPNWCYLYLVYILFPLLMHTSLSGLCPLYLFISHNATAQSWQ